MTKKINEVVTENAENTVVEEKKAKTTTRRKKTVKPQETKVEEVKENSTNIVDLDAVLSTPKYTKKALSFYQDKSVAEELTARAKAKGKKNSEALNLILNTIIDLENGVCKIDIDEKKEEKIANTFKVDERILNVLNKEADSRNMSVNEYLNKVLKVVLNLNGGN